MKKVIIVESSAKTKTIRQFLRGEYNVIACGGHIVDLPKNDLGIDVVNNFRYNVEPQIYRGRNKVEYLRNNLSSAEKIYIATDPDREGEAIAADIVQHCIPDGISVQRIEFNAIVYHAVKEALENPRNIDQNRVQAQRARRSLDRLIGFILSSMVKFDEEGPNLPAVGRVIAPAVALVVDRENEIDSFIPKKFWTIYALFKHEESVVTGIVDGEWENFESAKAVREKLLSIGSIFVKDCIEIPDNHLNPLPPYSTDALQNDADRILGFSPEKTMTLAQQLYQGVEIEGKSYALITYMRTDSTRVSPTAINLAKKTISENSEFGENYYKGRSWKPNSAAQDAHEAIRPAMPGDIDFSPEFLADKIPENVIALYRLIYFRFLASQMKPAIYRTVKLSLEADGIKATAEGHQLISEGFLKAYRKVQPKHGWEETPIPTIGIDAKLKIENVWPEPQKTIPPFRYREGTLVSELKNRGIGRPSTYAATLKKIKDYRYVQKVGRNLRPTDRGKALCKYFRQHYNNVMSYEYTAEMEIGLSGIEQGSIVYEEYLSREFDWLRKPYQIASRNGWIQSDLPSMRQVELLRKLSNELCVEVPEYIFRSKIHTENCIDELIKLKNQQPVKFNLSQIDNVDVGGHECYRIRFYYNPPLEDDNRNFLKRNRMRYIGPENGNPPCYQFQRQDRKKVEELRTILLDRFHINETSSQ
jgi:DNA topoisomerase-1